MATTTASSGSSAATSTGSTAGASSSLNAADGNSQLQDAFNTAIAQAQQTLQVSTAGQAVLNALRARPQ